MTFRGFSNYLGEVGMDEWMDGRIIMLRVHDLEHPINGTSGRANRCV